MKYTITPIIDNAARPKFIIYIIDTFVYIKRSDRPANDNILGVTQNM